MAPDMPAAETPTTIRPVRLRLKRRSDDQGPLQQRSRTANGLACVKVDRSSIWGNPYKVKRADAPLEPSGHEWRVEFGDVGGAGGMLWTFATREEAQQFAVDTFRWTRDKPEHGDLVARAKAELAAKNLACWCALTEPCHADVWLEIVNR